jgi:hypothetical protein
MDYECERGAKRNFEPWRESKLAEETEEERLDSLEREEAQRDVMADLEQKTLDAKTEMAVADALDEIRVRNARLERAQQATTADETESNVQGQTAQELEDEEAARRAFITSTGERVLRTQENVETDNKNLAVSFQRFKKKHKESGILSLGIKRKSNKD